MECRSCEIPHASERVNDVPSRPFVLVERWEINLILGDALLYVVWQKSNETDFILTMNFILFTNQGYPLQNSSLGQLHSDGGVVSIVHSSAGRFLLVYLSARRLRSSGYYP